MLVGMVVGRAEGEGSAAEASSKGAVGMGMVGWEMVGWLETGRMRMVLTKTVGVLFILFCGGSSCSRRGGKNMRVEWAEWAEGNYCVGCSP